MISDAFAFVLALCVVLLCAVEWVGHPETYSHPDNYSVSEEIR